MGKNINLKEPFMYKLVSDVVDIMGLVNKILGNDSSSAKFLRNQMREAE